MLTNDAVEGDEVLTEALKLKRVAAFKDLDADKADAYSLLQKDDLLPAHQAERLIGSTSPSQPVSSLLLQNIFRF